MPVCGCYSVFVMCAAKKTSRKPATTKASPAPVRGRYLGTNPLPEGECGPRLLVRLQAEKVIEKLKLKEKWEVEDGWDFEDLCAVVACALGENFVLPGEPKRAASVRATLSPSILKRIEAKANPDIVHETGEVVSLEPEVYQGYLILGLGHSEMPLDRSVTATEGLTIALAKYMDVKVSKVTSGTFARAKRVAFQRYQAHLEKQAKREQMTAVSPADGSGLERISATDLLRGALGKLARDGKLPAGETAELTSQTRDVLLKAGLKHPGMVRKNS